MIKVYEPQENLNLIIQDFRSNGTQNLSWNLLKPFGVELNYPIFPNLNQICAFKIEVSAVT